MPWISLLICGLEALGRSPNEQEGLSPQVQLEDQTQATPPTQWRLKLHWLVSLLWLVEQIPTPPPPAKHKRGRQET